MDLDVERCRAGERPRAQPGSGRSHEASFLCSIRLMWSGVSGVTQQPKSEERSSVLCGFRQVKVQITTVLCEWCPRKCGQAQAPPPSCQILVWCRFFGVDSHWFSYQQVFFFQVHLNNCQNCNKNCSFIKEPLFYQSSAALAAPQPWLRMAEPGLPRGCGLFCETLWVQQRAFDGGVTCWKIPAVQNAFKTYILHL